MPDAHPDKGWFCTASGRKVYIEKPELEDIFLTDIAKALSQICRFGGHVDTFYSVAQHSVLVSQNVAPCDARWGLMHDAAEAYVGDVISPLKYRLTNYERFEMLWMDKIAARFGLDGVVPGSVVTADRLVFITECRDVASVAWRNNHFEGEPALMKKIVPLSSADAEQLFLDRWQELSGHTVAKHVTNGGFARCLKVFRRWWI